MSSHAATTGALFREVKRQARLLVFAFLADAALVTLWLYPQLLRQTICASAWA